MPALLSEAGRGQGVWSKINDDVAHERHCVRKDDVIEMLKKPAYLRHPETTTHVHAHLRN
jgi:hypothetical protein